MLEHALGTWKAGGFVVPPLFLCTVLLWWTLGMRFVTLRRGDGRNLRQLLSAARASKLGGGGMIVEAVLAGVELTQDPRRVRARVGVMVEDFHAAAEKGATTVLVIAALAPLLGLLGTVTGMIETFDALATMTLFSRSGGIAGGVSQALVSTQMGLAVAIPGVLAGRFLADRQKDLETELDELGELLVAEAGGAPIRLAPTGGDA